MHAPTPRAAAAAPATQCSRARPLRQHAFPNTEARGGRRRPGVLAAPRPVPTHANNSTRCPPSFPNRAWPPRRRRPVQRCNSVHLARGSLQLRKLRRHNATGSWLETYCCCWCCRGSLVPAVRLACCCCKSACLPGCICRQGCRSAVGCHRLTPAGCCSSRCGWPRARCCCCCCAGCQARQSCPGNSTCSARAGCCCCSRCCCGWLQRQGCWAP